MYTSQLTVQGVGISALVTGALSSGTITSSMLSLHHSITEYVDADPSNSSAYNHNYAIMVSCLNLCAITTVAPGNLSIIPYGGLYRK